MVEEEGGRTGEGEEVEEMDVGGDGREVGSLLGDVPSRSRVALMGDANGLICRMTDATPCGVGQNGSPARNLPISLPLTPAPFVPAAVALPSPVPAAALPGAPFVVLLSSPRSDSTRLILPPSTSIYRDARHCCSSEVCPLSPAIASSRAATPMFPAIALPTRISKKRSAALCADPRSSDCMVRCSGCSALRGKSELA